MSSVNNSKAYSGQQGCVTIPARKCKEDTGVPDWAVGKPLVSKFLFNKDDIAHLRRGSVWAEQMDPEQQHTAFRIIECTPADTGKCEIKSEYSHIQFINAGFDLEKGFGLGDDEEAPQIDPSFENLMNFLNSFLSLIIWLKDAHLAGFSHNDIKLDNICFDGQAVRLIDFSDRSHTVWIGEDGQAAVLKSKGLGGIMAKFTNNQKTMKLQITDINNIKEILLDLLNNIMEPFKLSLKYARALKIALHSYNDESNNNDSTVASEIYSGINTRLQFFLKILIVQLKNVKADEIFAKEPINYTELQVGRQLTKEEKDCVKTLQQKLRDEAFMRTWSEEDDASYKESVSSMNRKVGGGRRTRRLKRQRRRTLRRRL